MSIDLCIALYIYLDTVLDTCIDQGLDILLDSSLDIELDTVLDIVLDSKNVHILSLSFCENAKAGNGIRESLNAPYLIRQKKIARDTCTFAKSVLFWFCSITNNQPTKENTT